MPSGICTESRCLATGPCIYQVILFCLVYRNFTTLVHILRVVLFSSGLPSMTLNQSMAVALFPFLTSLVLYSPRLLKLLYRYMLTCSAKALPATVLTKIQLI